MSAVLLDKQTAPVPGSEDDVGFYLAMIRSYPRLSQEEERELAEHLATCRECRTLAPKVTAAHVAFPSWKRSLPPKVLQTA